MIAPFGTCADGPTVDAITLAGHGLRLRLLTLGAILQDLRLDGLDHSLTLGRDSLADYEGSFGYYGALIAPVANRLRNARAIVGGKKIQLEPNENGRTALHSGSSGTHQKIWQVNECTEIMCQMSVELPYGEGGFPGNRRISARFELCPDACLRLTIRSETDADTLINATNHSYWNLDGTNSVAGHSLRIAADHVLPTDKDTLPTGVIRPVAGGPFDFRAERVFAPGDPPLDHNFCLSRAQVPLREVLWLRGQSGVAMTLSTTEPGVQVYDHRDRDPRAHGLAIEPQGWPDAPNCPGFPPILLRGGETCKQISEWRFSRG